MASLFLTGASGFIGRALLDEWKHGQHHLVLLERNTPLPVGDSPNLQRVQGGLSSVPQWAAALAGTDVIVHLAAVTGKAPRRTYSEINVQGTAALLDAARQHGVRRFLFVSTIATRYRDAPHYHYAQSKRQAEELVRASPLRVMVLRPTIVLGPGSPIGARLRSLASLPIMPVPGTGGVRVQPIDVRDLAAVIAAVVDEDRFEGEILEAGGPDVLPMEDLLGRLRARLGKPPERRFHVPLGPARSALAAIEKLSLKLTPVTAGQLAAFANDSIAARNPFIDDRRRTMRDVERMVEDLATNG